LQKYAPRAIGNQGRPLKRLLDEWDRNRPAMAYFPEGEMMMMMMKNSELTFRYAEVRKKWSSKMSPVCSSFIEKTSSYS
jgi:hypothetical protein